MLCGFAAFRAESLWLSVKVHVGFEAMPQIARHSLRTGLMIDAREGAKPYRMEGGKAGDWGFKAVYDLLFTIY